MFILISLRTETATTVHEDQNNKGVLAEIALALPYLEQTISVT